jgi:hypothetical protein
MQVTRFQMHNVLDCYSKKLSSARRNDIAGGGASKKSAHDTALSPETSRMAAMEKISRQVLDKVMDVVALSSTAKTRGPGLHVTDEGAESTGEPAAAGLMPGTMDSIARGRNAAVAMGNPGE